MILVDDHHRADTGEPANFRRRKHAFLIQLRVETLPVSGRPASGATDQISGFGPKQTAGKARGGRGVGRSSKQPYRPRKARIGFPKTRCPSGSSRASTFPQTGALLH